ncbi:MAG: flagellin [Candidatus Caenarcaniphilales bacterium]|nr:flagellin [Candidatus Caenarcaniphilales bacterium]
MLSKVTTRSLNKSNEHLSNYTRKLSSGSRINKAGDDVASLSISAKLEANIKGIGKAQGNVLDAMGKLDVVKGGLDSTVDNLQRIRELFVQGVNGTNSIDEKNALQREINERILAVQNIAEYTRVAEQIGSGVSEDRILAGDYAFRIPPDDPGVSYQVGSDDSDSTTIRYDTIDAVTPNPEGIDISIDTVDQTGGISEGITLAENNLANISIPGATLAAPGGNLTDTDTLAHLDTMISNVSRMQSTIGAKYSFFQAKFDQLEEEKVAFSESRSHFEDADMAEASSGFVREQIRQQTAGAMYSQANAQASFALNLLP